MLKKHESYNRMGRPVVCNSSNTRQLGCVFQDMGAAEVFIDFTEELRHTETDPTCKIHGSRCTSRIYIRDHNPSLGLMCPDELHQRSPNAPKFEDRSLEETEWQEQGAREAAWKMSKSVFKN